jgi:hypothetical protein
MNKWKFKRAARLGKAEKCIQKFVWNKEEAILKTKTKENVIIL